MRAINHTVTGALIGAFVVNPFIALPAALFSHFILDIIPHSGEPEDFQLSYRFKILLLIDIGMSGAFLLSIILLGLPQWKLIVACGVLSAAPDVWWLPYWIWKLQGKPKKLDKIGQFLANIQWSETLWGYGVELVWIIGSVLLFIEVTSH